MCHDAATFTRSVRTLVAPGAMRAGSREAAATTGIAPFGSAIGGGGGDDGGAATEGAGSCGAAGVAPRSLDRQPADSSRPAPNSASARREGDITSAPSVQGRSDRRAMLAAVVPATTHE